MTKEIIEGAFLSLDFNVSVVEVNESYRFTEYRIELLEARQLSSILRRTKEIALLLGSSNSLSLYPITDTSFLGLKIPRADAQILKYADIIKDTDLSKYILPVIYGKTLDDRTIITDLTKAPHLLIAGQTGSGKSVFLNGIITTLASLYTPKDLQFYLIDFKGVEFTRFEHLPHLRAKVTTDPLLAIVQLQGVVNMMNKRYDMFNSVGVKTISQYKTLFPGGEEMPYIVVMIDEMADLLLRYKKQATEKLALIAQKARCAGIHLILATQKPSTQVLSGLIKTNIPSRIAFKVPSWSDSRVILESKGAESLLGNGDMYYNLPESLNVERVQAPFISEEEITAFMSKYE
jgi:S-DNA-T family DNA segregation ATPase FtsK/SpoIIIE